MALKDLIERQYQSSPRGGGWGVSIDVSPSRLEALDQEWTQADLDAFLGQMAAIVAAMFTVDPLIREDGRLPFEVSDIRFHAIPVRGGADLFIGVGFLSYLLGQYSADGHPDVKTEPLLEFLSATPNLPPSVQEISVIVGPYLQSADPKPEIGSRSWRVTRGDNPLVQEV